MTDSSSRRTLVLIGAGSAVFTRGLLADMISASDLGRWEIRLCDTNPEALEIAVRNTDTQRRFSMLRERLRDLVAADESGE